MSCAESFDETTNRLESWASRATRRREAVGQVIRELRDVWRRCSGEERAPSAEIIAYLLVQHHPSVLEKAISITAHKVLVGSVRMEGDAWYPYLLGVLRNLNKYDDAPPPLLTYDDMDDAELERDTLDAWRQWA